MAKAENAGKRLFLQCAGTRGDVQPFVGLALGLKKAGFVVQLGVPVCSVQFAKNLGVDAVGTTGDVEGFMNMPEVKELSARTDTLGIAKFGKRAAAWQKETFPDLVRLLLEAVKTFKPDVMFACGEICCQEVIAVAGAHGIPFIQAFLKLYYPSKYKASPAGEPRWMHGVIKFAMKAGSGIERGFKNGPLLEQLPECAPFLNQNGAEFIHNWEHPLAPTLIGHSSSMNELQDDWTQDMKDALNITGFWVVGRDAQNDAKDKPEFGGKSFEVVESFLANGEPPVYMGWGSMICGSPEQMTCLAVRSLMESGLRGIIVGSWAKLDASMLKGHQDTDAMEAYAKENILFEEFAPHELLFSRCSVLVHHGGLGTLAAGLRSGVPQVITPVFLDQPINGTILQESGCGVRAKSLAQLQPSELSEALKTCITDDKIKAKAAEMGKMISAEDGVTSAVEVVDKWITSELNTGNWKLKFEKRKQEFEDARAKWFFQKKF